MDIPWHTGERRLDGGAAFQIGPLAAAVIVALSLHVSAGWYLLQIVKEKKTQHSPLPLQFEVVTPPQPIPMSAAPLAPPQQTQQMIEPRQVIKKTAPQRLVRPVDPPKPSIETEKKVQKPEMTVPQFTQPKEPEPLIAPHIENVPGVPLASVSP